MKAINILTLAALMMTAPVLAVSDNIDPIELLNQVKWRDDGHSRIADVTLTLIDDSGAERQRQVTFTERDEGQTRSTRLLIKQPLDVKGTAILLQSDAEKASAEDDIWLYLPALKKVKRLAAQNKRGRFVGSEFTYADLEWLRVEDFNYQVVGTERFKDHDVIVISATPVDESVKEKTGYGQKTLWVCPEYNLIMRAEYFDDRGRKLKTMQVEQVDKKQGYWTPMTQTIVNHQTGKQTIMAINQIDFDIEIPAKQFRKQDLKRAQ